MPNFDSIRSTLAQYDAARAEYAPYADQLDGHDRAYEEYEDALTRLVHDLADAVRELVPPVPPTLPQLTPGADEAEALCQHVWTAEEAAERDQQRADWEAEHGTGGATWMPPLPVGETCGAELVWEEGTVDYRTAVRWNGGALVVGDSRYGDGDGNYVVSCDGGHQWETPEIDFAF